MRSSVPYLLCLLAVSAFAGSGYLSAVGPSPLRFRPAPKPEGVRVVLPPLPAPEPPVELQKAAERPTAALTETAQTNSSVAVVPTPVSPVANVTPSADTSQPAGPAMPFETSPEPRLIPPQVFVQFFRPLGGTNNPAAMVVAPVPFQPPPLPPPSSEASYQVR